MIAVCGLNSCHLFGLAFPTQQLVFLFTIGHLGVSKCSIVLNNVPGVSPAIYKGVIFSIVGISWKLDGRVMCVLALLVVTR